MTTTLPIHDGNNNPQNLIVNSNSGNYMPVHNIGDPSSANSANVLATSSSNNALLVSDVGQASVGLIPYFNDAVAGTKQQIKATQGNLYVLDLVNTTAANAYLQIFFLPSASVTVGSTTPDMTIRLPANGTRTLTFRSPIGALKSDGTTAGTGLTIAGTTTATGSTGAAISVAATYI